MNTEYSPEKRRYLIPPDQSIDPEAFKNNQEDVSHLNVSEIDDSAERLQFRHD